MKRIMLLCFLAVALRPLAALSVFIINNTDKPCAIVFVREGLKSAPFLLEPGERISEEKAFDLSVEKRLPELISFRSPDEHLAYEVMVDTLPPTSEISLGSPFAPVTPETAKEVPSSTLAKVGSFFSGSLYYLGSLISSPFGFLLGMDIGAKAGASIGLQYMTPQFATTLPGLANVLLGPVLPAWCAHAGATGGWILGGATGGILAPLVFITVWQGSSLALTYVFKPASKALPQGSSFVENDWVLLSDSAPLTTEETALLELLHTSVILVASDS